MPGTVLTHTIFRTFLWSRCQLIINVGYLLIKLRVEFYPAMEDRQLSWGEHSQGIPPAAQQMDLADRPSGVCVEGERRQELSALVHQCDTSTQHQTYIQPLHQEPQIWICTATYQLCDEQGNLLCASVSSSVEWGLLEYLRPTIIMRIIWIK